MNTIRSILTFGTWVLSCPAMAQLPEDTPGPLGNLEANVANLTERVAVLEASAPSPSVEGRSYCFVLDLEIMRGTAPSAIELTQSSIIRRTVYFSGGTMTGILNSHIRNTLDDDGIVIRTIEDSDNPSIAQYVQTGRKLDLMFDNGTTANWYVSADGSLISGTTIIARGPFPVPPANPSAFVTLGMTRNWTLVEGSSCDAEDM